MKPKQIKVVDKTHLKLTWPDDSQTIISLKYLRDECPCAGCKGETILFKTYRPAKTAETSPDMYKIASIKMTGGYAIQIQWKDGHATGIYTWDYLRQLEKDQDSGKSQDYNNLI